MNNWSNFGITEKLILAAYELEKKGKKPFSAEDLVVAAWKSYPDAFGLAGYQDKSGLPLYPDSNRVFVEIMGSKSIRKKGFIAKVGTKMYQLTLAGQEYAQILSGRSNKTAVKKVTLGREKELELKRLFDSKAWVKFKKGRQVDITFYDACAFWNISPRSSAIDFDGKIANFTKVIESARKAVQEEKATFKHGGYAFGTKEIEDLFSIHQFLLDRYANEITMIRSRKDERV